MKIRERLNGEVSKLAIDLASYITFETRETSVVMTVKKFYPKEEKQP